MFGNFIIFKFLRLDVLLFCVKIYEWKYELMEGLYQKKWNTYILHQDKGQFP